MDGTAIKAMMAEIAPVIREYVDATHAPLLERIASLEAEKGALAERCAALEEGASKPVEIDLATVEKLIETEIAKLPTPEPAKEVDLEQVAAMVSEAVSALSPPQDGKSIEIEDVLPAIAAEVERAVADIPTPKDGADGRGIKDLLIDRDGQLVATMSDGEMKTLGPVIGKDGSPGQPGKNGRDGFDLDAFDIKRGDDQRTLIFCFEGKDGGFEYEMTLQHPIYCGVFKEGQDYMPGDMVTWGGSLWHCNAETKEKPEAGPWTLAVKKGRDGKDAKNG